MEVGQGPNWDCSANGKKIMYKLINIIKITKRYMLTLRSWSYIVILPSNNHSLFNYMEFKKLNNKIAIFRVCC
jgi:hypothetical protein